MRFWHQITCSWLPFACFSTLCSASMKWNALAQQNCDAGRAPVRYIKTLQLANDAKARSQMENALEVVRPIMCEKQWSVGILHEFLPLDRNLLGLNINGGEEIKVRLRWSETEMVSYEQILGTLLHELSHNAVSGHDTDFWDMYASLQQSCRDLRNGKSCEDECLVATDAIDPLGELWVKASKCTQKHWIEENWVIGVIAAAALIAVLLVMCACIACCRRSRRSQSKRVAKRGVVKRMSSMRQHKADVERAIQLSLCDVGEDARRRPRLAGVATHCAIAWPPGVNPDASAPSTSENTPAAVADSRSETGDALRQAIEASRMEY